jgi:flagellar motor switch protein FliN/FliY
MEINLTNYDSLVDTESQVDVSLGNTLVTLKEFLNFSEGDIITLNKTAGQGGDIYVNSRIIGMGDIIVIDEKLAVRVQDAMDADGVVQYFFDENEII